MGFRTAETLGLPEDEDWIPGLKGGRTTHISPDSAGLPVRISSPS